MERLPYSTLYNPPAPVVTLRVETPQKREGETVQALVDSGADITVIPRSVTESLLLRMVDILPVAGFNTAPMGCPVYAAAISLEGRQIGIERVISWDGTHALLGRDILNRFKAMLDGLDKSLSIS